jgi:putative ABC transport system substrate-binding protein
MNRRDTLFALLALGVAPNSRAQSGRVYRIGYPMLLSARSGAALFPAFEQGLRELGYSPGKDLVIDYRSAEGKPERFRQVVQEILEGKPDVIIVSTTSTALALQHATTTIPIVMISIGDPVASGLVKSLARPGANITGLANLDNDTQPKLLEYLIAVTLGSTRFAVLWNSSNRSRRNLKNLEIAAQKAAVKLLLLDAHSPVELENAFARMNLEHTGAVLVHADAFFLEQKRQIGELLSKHRMPSIFPSRDYLEQGCLMSYGVSLADQYHQAATYVDKILKGAKPADLPVQQPTRFELAVNLKTAKALGINVPQSLLIRADRVIE